MIIFFKKFWKKFLYSFWDLTATKFTVKSRKIYDSKGKEVKLFYDDSLQIF